MGRKFLLSKGKTSKVKKEDNIKTKIDIEDYNLIKNSNLFSEKYYLKNYPEVKESRYDPIEHYILKGYLKGYNPSPNFDNNAYLDGNSDVAEVGLNPLLHYLKWGINERRPIYKPPSNIKKNIASFKHNLLEKTRSPDEYLFLVSKFKPNVFKKNKEQFYAIKESGLFDEKYYLENYPLSSNFTNDLVLHYMFIGSRFNYNPNSYFDTNYYKNTYNVDNPFYDYIINNRSREASFLNFIYNKEAYDILKNSELFDENYYIKTYPEINMDPITHYIHYGCYNGFNPSLEFNTDFYFENYPNVKKSIVNPLVHYIKYGKNEGKLPKPLSKEEANLISEKINKNALELPLYDFDDDAPLVSIIILNRNGLDYLKTLFSNFKDTIAYPNYEIIIIDNNSQDKSIEYLKNLSNDLPLRIIKNKTNESFSEANNKGVELAKGEYIVLLNNDMEPIYGWLNHMMHSYLESDEIGIVGAKLIFPFTENSASSLKTQNEGINFMELNGFYSEDDGYIVPYNIKDRDVFENESKKEIGSILGACLLIKKDLYQEFGGLDDKFIYNYEDIDLCFKAIDKGYKVIYEPKAKLYHYYQATRKEAFDLSPTDLKNRMNLFRKWNKWLCEKLVLDRLNEDFIFSENHIRFAFISTKDSYALEDTFSWEKEFIHYSSMSKISLKDNTDILVSDIYDLNPLEVNKNNKHLLTVAIIKNNLHRWYASKNIRNYDIILINKEFVDDLIDIHPNVFILNEEPITKQIKNALLELYEFDKVKFNDAFKNYEFKDAIENGLLYSSIVDSEFFDDEWYEKSYNISKDNLDPANHYLSIGGFKGYNPGPNFNTKFYLDANRDVKRENFNPLAHYELFGRREGRYLSASLKDKISFKIYSFLIKDSVFPLTKKLFRTRNNRILFYSPWQDEVEGKLNENSQMIYDNLPDKYEKIIHTKKAIGLGEYLKTLYKILSSKVIITDSGISALSKFTLKEEQKLINIWHACGAFKKIAFDVKDIDENISEKFKKEFSQYTNFIVSSENIRNIYAKAHKMNVKDVLPLGVPRTDIFLDHSFQKDEINKLYENYPILKDKEVILYAPTFRDFYTFDSCINWDGLSEKLNKNEIIVIKRHPMMVEDLLNGKTYDNIIYIEDESLFRLMFISEMMITDYSSVIFEYSLLNKPVIHFCPDFDDYIGMRGFYLDFNNDLYGDIVKDPNDLIEIILNKDYKLNKEKLEKFKDKYMKSCDGKATNRIIKLIERYMEN